MPYAAHTPTMYGMVPSTTPGVVNASTGDLVGYRLPAIPSYTYPSFRGFGEVPADATAATLKDLVTEASKQVALAQSAYSTSGQVGALTGFTTQGMPRELYGSPSNEIGARLRIAYFLSLASRVCSGRKEFAKAKRLLDLAKTAAMQAASDVRSRFTAAGHLKDSGKVMTPAQISGLLKQAAGVARQAGVIPAWQLLTKASNTTAIAAQQELMDEAPGAQNITTPVIEGAEKLGTALVVGGVLAALAIGYAMSK